MTYNSAASAGLQASLQLLYSTGVTLHRTTGNSLRVSSLNSFSHGSLTTVPAAPKMLSGARPL